MRGKGEGEGGGVGGDICYIVSSSGLALMTGCRLTELNTGVSTQFHW